MYCTHCGVKVIEHANYCSSCGSEVQSRFAETGSQHFDPPFENPSEENQEYTQLETFVGDNSSYYIQRWKHAKSTSSKESWNWPSFLLSLFWLGYRKMYGYLFAACGIILFTSVIGIILEAFYPGLGKFIILPFTVMVILFGIYGNSLYLKHAENKVKWIKKTSVVNQNINPKLVRSGGTSWRGVITAFALGLLTFSLAMTGNVINNPAVVSVSSFTESPEIIFGTGEGEVGITGVTNTFSSDEKIFYEAYFGERIEASQYEVYIIKINGPSEELYANWAAKSVPSWKSVYGNLYDPSFDKYTFENGRYLVKIFANDELLCEGRFRIQDFNPSESL